MDTMKHKRKTWIATLIAGLSIILLGRWMPHPPNFTPLIGCLIFCSTFFKSEKLHFVLPIFGLWVSDLLLNNLVYAQYFEGWVWFSDAFLWSSLAFIIIALISQRVMKTPGVRRTVGMTVTATLIFFIVSNFGVWASSPLLYTRDISGLLTAFIAGIPFVLNSLAGDLFYTAAFFGLYYLANKQDFVLRFQLNA